MSKLKNHIRQIRIQFRNNKGKKEEWNKRIEYILVSMHA